MKFNSKLTEATLLKRTLKFLVEVVLQDKTRLMIRCPNLGELNGCDTLGSRVWFSQAIGHQSLHTWELVEVDGGFLVGVNRETVRPLIIEGISDGVITELQGYRLKQSNPLFDHQRQIELVLEKDNKQCFLGTELITYGDGRGDGYFPDSLAVGTGTINHLINLKQDGHRAILFYCVQNTGINCIKPADQIDPEYGKALRQAIRVGVEVLAYRTEISLEGLKLTTPIPVLYSEGIPSQS